LSLGAKERRIEADLCQKYEDLVQKYLVQKVGRSFTKIETWRTLYYLFATFASSTSCLF